MQVSEEELIELVQSIKEIGIPNSPTVPLSTFLPQLDIYCKLLLAVINSSQTDPALARLDKDFHKHLRTIVDNNLGEYSIAIEALAQKFEAFLKKLGYLNYANTHYWTGTLTSKGIKETTLKKLCDGVLDNRNNAPKGTPPLKLPKPLFNNSGIQQILIDWARDKVRNAVHQAPEISRQNIILYSEIIIVCYLIVVKDNTEFLKQLFLPEAKYKQQLLKNFAKWKEKYITLEAEKIDPEIMNELFPLLVETDWQANDEEILLRRKGNIIEIFEEVKRLVIIGQAGSGKSTTLQYLAYNLLQDDNKIPFYFPLKEYTSRESLLNQIASEVGIETVYVKKMIAEGKAILLLDGLNEVIREEERRNLIIEINSIKAQYKNCLFALTTRVSILQHQFELPVFELQPLSDKQIEEFVRKNSSINLNLFETLKLTQPRFIELCRNPLILKMLCSVMSDKNINIPETKGLLIESFINNILQREQFKNTTFSSDKLNFFLLEIGYQTRSESKVSFPLEDILTVISKASAEIDPLVDRLGIINSLVDINFLVRNKNQISFRHELYQEFFAAKGLLKKSSIESIGILFNKKEWEEPLLLYFGLTNQRREFLINLSGVNPLLAAESILSSLIIDENIENEVVKLLSNQALNIEDGQLAADSISALVKLNHTKIVQHTISINFNKFGRRSFKHYPQIAYEIVKKIDGYHFLDLVQLLLNLDQSFAPAIIRGFEDRDIQEDLELLNIVRSNVHFFDFKILKPAYAYKLLLLIKQGNSWRLANFDVHEYCTYLLAKSNSKCGNLLLSQLDWSNEELISRLFTLLNAKENKNPLNIFWFFYKKYPSSLSVSIILACINGKNLYLQVAALFLCIRTNNRDLVKGNEKLTQINMKSKVVKKISSINALPVFLETIEQIVVKIRKDEYLEEMSKRIGQSFKCKVVLKDKGKYHAVELNGCLVKAMLPIHESDMVGLNSNRKQVLYLTKINFNNYFLEFSTTKPTLSVLLRSNYEIGKVINVIITRIDVNSYYAQTDLGITVKIPFGSNKMSVLTAKDKVRARVLDNIDGLKLKLLIPKKSIPSKPTLLGEKLRKQ